VIIISYATDEFVILSSAILTFSIATCLYSKYLYRCDAMRSSHPQLDILN